MADLIAQGADPSQRWRRALPVGRTVVLGRMSPPWSTPWDDRISREHLQVTWDGRELRCRQLASARNPTFVRGNPVQEFAIRPGEHFVIGGTSFSVSDEQANVSVGFPAPAQERSFTAQYLKRLRYRDADERIEILSRLPEVIAGAATDAELFVRLVNVLLLGVREADAAAIVAVADAGSTAPVRVLHWDRRGKLGGAFQPSERLIQESIRRRESLLHLWNVSGAPAFTQAENYDWACCTPVPGEPCRGWGLYLAGKFARDESGSPEQSDPADLRDDLKFTEMAAATLGSLRELRLLSRQHAGLSQFFSPVVLEALAEENPERVLAPRETDVSVLFCDLRGFSLRSERAAGDLLGLLERVSQALGVMTHQILDQGGVVGDFQGDAAMGFWGWPMPQPDSARRSCLSALGIWSAFSAAARLPDHPLAGFQMGIGIARGRAVAGKIGTADHVKVTVFGPVVNLASRLEGMTKIFRAPILIDEPTATLLRQQAGPGETRVRRVAKVRPFGLGQAVQVFELLPGPRELPEFTDQAILDYEQALVAFESGDWAGAFELLHKVPAADRVKDHLIAMIAQHNRSAPGGWDGVIALSAK